MDLINQMWELLNTLSQETQSAIIAKCEELGLDQNRGEIPLQESFINLSQSRDILLDAVQRDILIQLPLTFQKQILGNLENIVKYQNSFVSGTDEVINLVTAIEALYSNIWKFGLHKISDKLLGYMTKMNQLKELEIKAKELHKELEQGVKVKSKITDLLLQLQENTDVVKSKLEESTTNSESVQQYLDKTTELQQKASSILLTIEQNEKAVTQLLTESKTSTSNINSLEAQIKDFFASIESYKTEINTTGKAAKDAVIQYTNDTKELIDNLKVLEDQIKDQIQKATGHSLFHSFQTRQENIKKSKNFWAKALGSLIAATMILTAVIAFSHQELGVAFYLKLSISVPLIYAITFCTVQYSRERKLEEEYAFKSNISISLVPYKELVEKIIDKNNDSDREKYSNFIIDSINKVFTSPTDKVFDGSDEAHMEPDKALKRVSKMMEAIVKPLEPLLKTLHK